MEPEATVTEIRCWISHNKLQLDLRGPHPWTLNMSALDNTPPNLLCVYVCVHIWVSFRPYLLMEASKAPESLCIFNDVKLSFRSAVCCSKEKERWIKHKCNKLCIDTIKNQKNTAVRHGYCWDSILDIAKRNRVFYVAEFFFSHCSSGYHV